MNYYGYDPMLWYQTKRTGLHVGVVMFAACSLIDLFLYITNFSHFWVSAAIPRYLPMYGTLLDDAFQFYFGVFGVIGVVLSFIYVAGILYSWWNSKKKGGKYIGTIILLSLDTLVLLLVMLDAALVDPTDFVWYFLLDIMFQFVILFVVFSGIHANKKLAALVAAAVKEREHMGIEEDIENADEDDSAC
ncbi:MAG: hypothetical protein IJY66_02055 [Clostridia bacterium]|nr:hypothetical protein [Clostridia bacterium]